MSAGPTWVDDHFIGGDVAVDFANTVYRRTPELGADLFDSVDALTAWLDRVDLLPPSAGDRNVVPGGALADARALRALLWAAFDAQVEDRDVPGGALAGLLDAAGRHVTGVALHADGSLRASAADGALSIIAMRALVLLLHPPSQGLRACDRCGWFFIDTSRGRRRRWCSMKTCGNQAKAARHRAANATR